MNEVQSDNTPLLSPTGAFYVNSLAIKDSQSINTLSNEAV